MGLESLPAEILLSISFNCHTQEDNANLRLTSRRLAAAAAPALFSTITLINHPQRCDSGSNWDVDVDPEVEDDSEAPVAHVNPSTKMDCILSVPSLAAYVTTIQIQTQVHVSPQLLTL